MSSGPWHYREAERLMSVRTNTYTETAPPWAREAAIVHATLAVAASNIEAATRRPSAEWSEVVA